MNKIYLQSIFYQFTWEKKSSVYSSNACLTEPTKGKALISLSPIALTELNFRQLSLFDLDFDLEFDTADANQLAEKLREQATLLEEEDTAEDNNNPPKGRWITI